MTVQLATHRTFSVWYRQWIVFTHHWKTDAWPPFVEAFVAIAALGIGLGGLVQEVQGRSYLEFVAPAIAVMFPIFIATFEGLWGAWFRMENNKTYDAMLATPVDVEDVVSGEILWGASRALLSGFALVLICALFGTVSSWTVVFFLPLVFLVGLMFTALSLAFTSLSPSIYFLGVFFTLIVTPMIWISGTFSPVDTLPGWLQPVAVLSPLTHANDLARASFYGTFDGGSIVNLAVVAGVALVSYLVVLRTMRRRLVK
jgi:lipooligosaccharide transport system permease protein